MRQPETSESQHVIGIIRVYNLLFFFSYSVFFVLVQSVFLAWYQYSMTGDWVCTLHITAVRPGVSILMMWWSGVELQQRGGVLHAARWSPPRGPQRHFCLFAFAIRLHPINQVISHYSTSERWDCRMRDDLIGRIQREAMRRWFSSSRAHFTEPFIVFDHNSSEDTC